MILNKALWTALITPMSEDGAVDFESLGNLVRCQEKAGNGILLIGSTGEGLALDDEEKKGIVKYVSDLKPNVPIMAGVGGFNLQKQVDWIEFCNNLTIDAFLLVNPLYSKPGPKGQTIWFKTLLDRSDLPCMIYNIPSRTGIDLHIDVVNALKEHKNFRAIKEASGSLEDYRKFRYNAPDISLYSGDDALLAFFTSAGCDGLVSVAGNVWPHATALYTDKCLEKKTDNLFPLWDYAVQALFSASNPIPVKRLLKEKGIIKTSVLRPPLTEDELEDLTMLIQIDEEIETWYNENTK